MGRNFVSICHKHKVKVWYFRGEESRPMHDFYRDHENCMRISPINVRTYDDQLQETLIPDYRDITPKSEGERG